MYILGTVKKPPAISGEYRVLSVLHYEPSPLFSSPWPPLLEGVLLAPTLSPCRPRGEQYSPRRLPKRQQRALARLPTPACCHQVRGWVVFTSHCCWWLPCSSPIGGSSRRSNAQVPRSPPPRLSFPASPFPVVTLPFLAEIAHPWPAPWTLFSSGNAAKQALL